MKVFQQYADYYDLLYADKDYRGEARFVLDQLGYQPGTRMNLLELGCGSGRHAVEFACAGLAVEGIDASPEMVGRANSNVHDVAQGVPKPKFSVGDVRTLSLNCSFDYVVSLFHVFSYQTTNADLEAAFQTAARHLSASGTFLFDFWYGPAVQSDPPAVRVRRLRGPDYSLTRTAKPKLRASENCVDVHYEVVVEPDGGRTPVKVDEIHRMRYLFLPEIEDYLSRAGLHLRKSGGWMKNEPLSTATWYGWVTAQHGR